MLLGLLREGEGIAAVMLGVLDVRLDMVRSALQPDSDPFAAWACAFCGKGRDSVRHLIQGPGWVLRAPDSARKQALLICDECVAKSSAVIAEAETKRAAIEAKRTAIRAEKQVKGADSTPPA